MSKKHPDDLFDEIRTNLAEIQERLDSAEDADTSLREELNFEIARLREVIEEEGRKWHMHHLLKGHFDKALYWEEFIKKATYRSE